MFGTLLGLVRDDFLMPWDYDIDFAILKSDADKIFTDKKLISGLAGVGMVMKKSLNCALKIYRIDDVLKYCGGGKEEYCHIKTEHVDLFTYTRTESKDEGVEGVKKYLYRRSRLCSWSPKLKKATDPYYLNGDDIFPLAPTTLSNYDGIGTYFPREPIHILEKMYGKSWTVPIYTDRKNNKPKKIKYGD